ncbi:MAG: polyphosphate polymerase domain-containing protein [Alistipes sp.]|nr:polyphosphate polymerase domain-containing protein [Alistipes sp.]
MHRGELTYEALNTMPLWRDMASITLDEMRDVKLMNRIDTKYVLSEAEVLDMLHSAAKCGYRVQVIDGVRACRYDTLYYDTSERDMFRVHHNQQLTRQKIRTRLYVETAQAFLEIKNKTNRGRTKKRRIAIAQSELHDFNNASDAVSFYNKNARYAIDDVSPALATRFTRITLVNPELTERLTIDLGLSYEDVRTRRVATIPGMAIVELKQDGNTISTMKRILRDMRIAPLKVSKYCLGTTLTVESIKRNRFKLKLRDIEKRLGFDTNDSNVTNKYVKL